MSVDDVVTKDQWDMQPRLFYCHPLQLARVACGESIKDRPHPALADVVLVSLTYRGASDIPVAGVERQLSDLFFQRHDRHEGVHPLFGPVCRAIRYSTAHEGGEEDDG